MSPPPDVRINARKQQRTFRQPGGSAFRIPADIADESQVERLIATTVRRFGRIDILVNNAGIFGGGRLVETSTKAFDEVHEYECQRHVFFCCRAGFAQMKKQGGGTIINMSSVAGLQAWSSTGAYSASKHAVMALTKTLAEEGRAHHIKVSAICPGGVADELVEATALERWRSEKIDPYDIAETALYLACLGPAGGGAPDRGGSPGRGLVKCNGLYDLGDGMERLQGMLQKRRDRGGKVPCP